MREILFRGKRTDNGEWIEGFYVAANHHWHKHGRHRDWIVCDAYANGGWFALGVKHPVITGTVGQFTGLTDKNGKKIFEGDIVQGQDRLKKYLEVFEVVECKDGSFVIVGDFMTRYRWLDYDVEVIGNIHDNPELLKGGE